MAGQLSVSNTAALMGTSKRTLQRRLTQYNLSYSKIVDQVRIQVAHDLLDSRELRVADISVKLGYADAGSFTRAFKRWSGMTPRCCQRQHRTKLAKRRA